MRSGNFELRVVRPDTGVPFHEVQSSGDNFIVASPGDRYEVHVTSLVPDPHPSRRFNCQLTIDGKQVGICGVLDAAHATYKFLGFVQHGSTERVVLDLFKFGAAQDSAGERAQSLDFKEGRMKVVVQEMVWGPECKGTSSGAGASSSTVPTLPEGKKFFLKPSLTTHSAGSQVSRGFSQRSAHLVGPVLATFDLRYETPSTLMLRQVLRREIPLHAAILDSFPETRASTERERQRQNLGMAPTQPMRVKRERAEVVVLDGAEQLAPGEKLECDLTGDDDAEPKWNKRLAR